MAKIIEASDPHAAWATMNSVTVLRIFGYGLLAGLITYLLYIGIDKFVFEPILCRESAALARCDSKSDFAAGTAIVIGSLLGLFLLVRERVYRPILAILGVMVALWGVFSLLGTLNIFVAGIISVVLFGISYVLFSWLVQPTSLVISLSGVIIAAAIARLAIG